MSPNMLFGHDDVELARVLDHLHAERVDVEVRGLDVGYSAPPRRSPLPEVAHERIAFDLSDMTTRAARATAYSKASRRSARRPCASETSSWTATSSECPSSGAARADVGALGVLAEHDEVDVRREKPLSGQSRSSRQRTGRKLT
jgi:hypothetical protein